MVGAKGEHRPVAQEFRGKYVIIVTRTGHWFYGRAKYFDGGVVLTNVARLLPMLDESGNEVKDSELMMTVRRAYPFIIPVPPKKYVVRKMWIPYSSIQLILRAKDWDEILKEEEAKKHAKTE